MKFIYTYNSSDNQRHEDVISASSRDEAYNLLRKRGIRPIRVVDAPGVVNKLFGKGKRWIAIGFLLCIVLALSVISFRYRSKMQSTSLVLENQSPDQNVEQEVKKIQSEPRSQVYGDPSVLQAIAVRDYRDVSEELGDQFLARFAQPGAAFELPVTKKERQEIVNSIECSINTDIILVDGDSLEVAKLKRIVNGMKAELRSYVEKGGTAELYVVRLIERQKIEHGIYENIKAELQGLLKRMDEKNREHVMKQWDEKNALLRSMGLKTLIMPQSLYE